LITLARSLLFYFEELLCIVLFFSIFVGQDQNKEKKLQKKNGTLVCAVHLLAADSA
jgi:hypothetical protein